MNWLYDNSPHKPTPGTISAFVFSTIAYRNLSQSKGSRGLVAFYDTAYLNGRLEISYDGEAGPAGVDFVSGNCFSALELEPQIRSRPCDASNR